MVEQATDPMAPTAADTEPGSAATIDSQEAARTSTATAISLGVVERGLYTDRQLLAEGGMGKVVIAHDARLGRKVAIKELRIDHPAARARFEREAALTARLEHPGIVGIHEAGKWPSGEPFFAMRVIAGRSLDKLFAERKDRRDRLALVPNVLAVADAVAYAHQLRIIHRDLKPQNVMVGEFGETVVIDWGLAKELGSDELASIDGSAQSGDLTTAGSVIGTPMYLPPEQARGEEVDRTADVYAIGAILYELCAGRPPYTARTVEELLEIVIEGPPEALPSDVPAELVAITGRAMARERSDRYPSARELAEDLRRFQTGQLVGAHRYTTGQLLGRWMRRHRAILVTSAVALVALLVLGVYSVYNIMAERREANAQRALADSRSEQALSLVWYMQNDLREQLELLNRVDLLDPVSRTVIKTFEGHPDQSGNSNIGLMMAYKNLADALRTKGDLDGATSAVKSAIAAFDRLRSPQVPPRADRAAFSMVLGDIAQARGDKQATLAHYRDGVSRMESLHAEEPANLELTFALAQRRGQLAEQLGENGETKAGLEEARRAEALLGAKREVPAPLADRLVEARAGLAVTLAELLASSGDSTGAAEQLQRAVDLRTQLAGRDKRWTAQRALALSLQRLGGLRASTGDSPGALTAFRAALAIVQKAHDADPRNAVAERDVGTMNRILASSLVKLKDFPAARTHAEAALTIAERASARSPENDDLTGEHATALDRLVLLEGAAKNWKRATELAARATERRLAVATRNPKNAAHRRSLMSAYSRHASVLKETDERAAAKQAAVAALEIATELANAAPADRSRQRDLSVMHSELAELLTDLGEHVAALVEYRADFAIAEKLAASDPTSTKSQKDLAESHAGLGVGLGNLGKRVEADKEFETAFAVLAKLPPDPELVQELTAKRDKCCR
ncbi:MAG: serine/threonine protein kinase [Deltaproteobacteria bacterium]|nr:serine/threonine protein kinase [Deltaproteobacteria bacterium]